ncbi:DUF4089 domain-containing protein [Falsiroseomonas stagni]|uniref:DUF4089 domain-containing protein n=1 Tax=Falsiroseomonas stagni DSM 19981 TaxID=1123062 RepID=A0A1I4C3F5_9PROT|nr:DUF4089 domain-containing protein [Falsiroseomonas stagni]SFK74726.1 Protein of unknown function [Falsiroseomonas stagni DSM 19981]
MTDEDLEAHARATAALLGLPIAPHQMPGVIAGLKVAVAAAALIERVPLTEAEEAAPVFRA